MKDLVFIVKSNGDFEVFPTKKLRAGSVGNKLVVVANMPFDDVVKVNYTIARVGDVAGQFMLPQVEKGRDYITQDKSYFQEYADANVWAINVNKRALKKFSRIADGEIKISFEFLSVVDAIPSGATCKGDIVSDEVPSASNGEYYVVKVAKFEVDNIIANYGQVLLYEDDKWQKVGRYRMSLPTATETLLVEPAVVGGLDDEDIDEDDVYTAIGQIAEDVESRALQSDLDDVVDGTTVVGRADKDGDGQVITSTYVKSVSGTANPTDIEVEIELENNLGDGGMFSKYFMIPFATTLNAGVMSASDKAKLDNTFTKDETYNRTHIDGELLLKEDKNKKGAASGYAPLDENAKLPLLYLYDNVLGQLEYVGTFNGANVPTQTQNLSPNRSVRKGDYFIATGNGLINGVDFRVGDWLIFDSATTWQKIDNTDAVASVNGKMGVVVLSGSDIEVGGGDTTKLQAKIVSVEQALADIYRKSETFTKDEVLNLIDQLKAIYGWENSYLGDLVALSEISVDGYDFVYIQAYTTDGKIDVTPVELGQLESNTTINVGGITVLYDHTAKELQIADYTGYGEIRVIGYKVEQQKAENISFENSDVDTELKRLETDKADKTDLTADNVDYDNTISELTATEVQSAIDELVDTKADKTTKVNGKALTGDVTLTAKDVIIDTGGGQRDGESVEYAIFDIDANKQDNLSELTQTDIDNKTEVPRVVTGKFIVENVLPQDSGWTSLSLQSGFTGSFKARKINKQVFLQLNIKLGDENDWDGSSWTYLLLGPKLLETFRPLEVVTQIVNYTNEVVTSQPPRNEFATLVVRKNGDVVLYTNRNNAKTRYIHTVISYLIE